MQWIKNFSIKTRIIFAYTVIITISVLNFLLLVSNYQNANNQLDKFNNFSFIALQNLLEADRDSYQSNLAISQSVDSLVYTNSENLRNNINAIEQNLQQFESRYKKFKEMYTHSGGERNEYFDIIELNFTELTKVSLQIRKLIENGDYNKAREIYYHFYLNTFNPMREAVNSLSEQLISESAAIYSSYKSTVIYVLVIALFLIITLILVCYISFILVYNTIVRPVLKTTKAIQTMATGKLERLEDMGDSLEISQIYIATNQLISGLEKVITFATAISKGDLNADFEPLSPEDELGLSILSMRDSIKATKNEETLRKIEDERRNWATQGIIKFGEILRRSGAEVQVLADSTLSSLIQYLDVIQGGLFLTDEKIEDTTIFELVSMYSFDHKKFTEKRIEIGESLVGTCGFEQKSILLTEIPDDYIKVESGFGQTIPQSLLLVPIKLDNKIFGVIELSSLGEFFPYQIDFIEKIAENLASSLLTIRINARTMSLFEQSRQQAFELTSKEEEMRQNFEELRSTQEESARKEAEMSSVLQGLKSDFLVSEYDLDGNILSMNEHYMHLLDVKYDDIIGTNLLKSVRGQRYIEFWEDFKKGLSRHEIRRLENHDIWISDSYTPILDAHGKPYKILNLAIDITESKKLELELKSRNEEMLRKQDELEEAYQKIKASESILKKSIQTSHEREREINRLRENLEIEVETQTAELASKVMEMEGLNNDFYAQNTRPTALFWT